MCVAYLHRNYTHRKMQVGCNLALSWVSACTTLRVASRTFVPQRSMPSANVCPQWFSRHRCGGDRWGRCMHVLVHLHGE